MILKRNDGSAIDLCNLKFTDSDKRLPRKRKKTLKRRLERDERLLKEWGAEF